MDQQQSQLQRRNEKLTPSGQQGACTCLLSWGCGLSKEILTASISHRARLKASQSIEEHWREGIVKALHWLRRK